MHAARLLAPALVALAASIGAPGAAVAQVRPAPPTVVTLMFDDGWRSQASAGDLLAAHGMRGTFFVDSGTWTYRDFMSRTQLRRLVRQGHEIAGHTLTHARLADLGPAERRREVCQDRANLLTLGTTVTSFAYPYGYQDAELRRIVADCGYASARVGDGLADRPPQDPLCDCVARLPFAQDRWAVPVKPTGPGPLDVATLERWVRQAERVGGWVPIVVGRICDGCAPGSVSQDDLTAFVAWLGRRPSTTRVETFADVVGPVSRQDVLHPLPPPQLPAPNRSTAVAPPGRAEDHDYALSVHGIGIGQAQIVGAFVIAAAASSVVFRTASRRRQTLRLRHTS